MSAVGSASALLSPRHRSRLLRQRQLLDRQRRLLHRASSGGLLSGCFRLLRCTSSSSSLLRGCRCLLCCTTTSSSLLGGCCRLLRPRGSGLLLCYIPSGSGLLGHAFSGCLLHSASRSDGLGGLCLLCPSSPSRTLLCPSGSCLLGGCRCIPGRVSSRRLLCRTRSRGLL